MSNEIGIIVGIALAALAVFLVTKPLRQSADATTRDETRLADLLAQRDAAYQVLRDLDSDYQVGKLSEDDYRPMRVQALAHAAEIVAQLDAYQQATEARPRIRKAPLKNQQSEINNAFCPHCGAPHAPDDAFCRKCGAALTEKTQEAQSTQRL